MRTPRRRLWAALTVIWLTALCLRAAQTPLRFWFSTCCAWRLTRLSSVHAVHVSAPPKEWPMPPENTVSPQPLRQCLPPQQPNRMLTPMMPRTKNRSRSDRATAANAAFTSRRCAVRQTGCAAVWPDSKHPYGAPRSLSPAMMIFRARLKTTSCLRYSRIFANFADAFCGSEKLLRSAVCNVI